MRPAYCPNCGARFRRTDASVVNLSHEGCENYGCHCKECGWNGKIVPDGGQDAVHHEGEE